MTLHKKLTAFCHILLLPVFALVCAIIFAGCDNTREITDVTVCVNDTTLIINNNLDLYADTFSVEKPIIFTTPDNTCDLSVTYYQSSNSTGQALTNNTIVLDEIVKGAFFEINLSRDNKQISAKLHLDQTDFPQFEVTGQGSISGDYYFTTSEKSGYLSNEDTPTYLVKMSADGKLKFYKKVPYYSIDFQKVVTTDNKIRYIYATADPEAYPFEDHGIDADLVNAKFVVLDENYQFVQDIHYQMPFDDLYPVEIHDLIYFNDDHYIIATNEALLISDIPDYMQGDKTKPMKVISCLLQEVKNNEVIWEFDSTDYDDLYQCYSTQMLYWNLSEQSIYRGYVDYMHFNAMSIDPDDGNLLVSFRDISSIMKINRTTGERMWVLGGVLDEFGLSDKFGLQHAVVSYGDGQISIFDNTNQKESSRVIEMTLDEVNKTATITNTIDLGSLSIACGSALRLDNSNYLVCYGVMRERVAKIAEINADTGEVSFAICVQNATSLYNVNIG